jgi:hypothetical protein
MRFREPSGFLRGDVERSMSMQPIQRWQYRLAFDLKVRNAYGVAFQDFFSTVMELVHGADFIRVRSFGSLGDKGCDGYRSSNGQVFQCYGKLADASPSSAAIVKKIDDDYGLAGTHLGVTMKEWHFAHNLVSGLPVEAVQKLEQLKMAGAHIVGAIGPTALGNWVLELSEAELSAMLGPAATAEDSRNLRLEEVRQLVDSLIASLESDAPSTSEVKPVPFDKLAFNKLPQHWMQLLSSASANGPYVRQYFEQHPNVETGTLVARQFSDRYKALKQEGLDAGAILDALYEQITGMGAVTAVRQVAAQAILAYLFDACDIFEDHPDKVEA